MDGITTIGVDLAKSVFRLHGVDAEGRPVLRRQPPCLIGMEACASADYGARELTRLGHDARLMPPGYVKGYGKRAKPDRADAAAICEAVARPPMRLCP